MVSVFPQQMPRHQDLILRRGCGAALAARAPATVQSHVASSAVPGGVPAAPGAPTAAVLSPLVIPVIEQYCITVKKLYETLVGSTS